MAKLVYKKNFLGARSSLTVPPSPKVPEVNIVRLGPRYRLVVVGGRKIER